jgi:DNA-directed RNA polymerase specialized sigma24 family protein
MNLVRQIIGVQNERFVELTLVRVVQSKMRYRSEAEDVVPETVERITRSNNFFESNFSTWLTRIGLNEAQQWYRKPTQLRVSQFQNDGPEERQSDGCGAVSARKMRAGRIRQIQSAVMELPAEISDCDSVTRT